MQAAIQATEEKSSDLMEWGSCSERRAGEATAHVQRAEQIIEKLAVCITSTKTITKAIGMIITSLAIASTFEMIQQLHSLLGSSTKQIHGLQRFYSVYIQRYSSSFWLR